MAVDCLHLEVNAHSADEGRGEGVIGIAEEEGGFANTAVADDEQFEHVVKILVGGIFDSSFAISHGSHLALRVLESGSLPDSAAGRRDPVRSRAVRVRAGWVWSPQRRFRA